MSARRFIGLLLAALFALPAALQAQPARPNAQKDGRGTESHIPVPFHGPPNGRFEDFLKGRVENASEHADTQEALRDLLKNLEKQFSPDDLKALKQDGVLDEHGRPPKLDDPKVRELLERWLENNRRERDVSPDGDGQPGGSTSTKRMVELLEKFLKDAPKGGGFATPNAPRSPDGGAQSQPPPDTPPRDEHAGGSNLPQPLPNIHSPPSLKEEGLRDSLSKFVEKMRESSLGNSPTLRRIGRELNRPILSRGENEGEGLLGKLPRLGEYIPFKRLFSAENLPSIGKPGWSGPRMPAVSAPSAGRMQGPSEGTVIGLLWIGLAVIAAVLLWKLLGGARTPPVGVQSAGWQLGPWPVNPADVATRQDLVRAFEYLSLLLLGPAARAWNHVEIASKLGASDDPAAMQRHNAASQLAALYEQARYAPPEELLPEDHLSDARRNLCLLAGVAAA
jgi:hypothetical protein